MPIEVDIWRINNGVEKVRFGLGSTPLSFILQDNSFNKKHDSCLTGKVQSLLVFRQLRPENPWCLQARLEVWFRLSVIYSLVAVWTPFNSIY